MKRITTNQKLTKTVRFLFFAFLTCSLVAQNGEKKITIPGKNISLKEAFLQIEQQTGYSVAYEQSNLDVEKKLSLSLKEASIDQAFTQILKNTKHIHRRKGYHIIISLPDGKLKTTKEKKQELTQTIRGIVIDAQTNTPIEYASVMIQKAGSLGAVTDSLGRFRISNIPLGRYNIQTSYVGYNTNLANGIPVTSSKEVYLEIPLDENIQSLNEIVIQPEVRKDKPLNAMAITGGRMISMEEASRFANGFDDPARLSSAFAGVAGDVGTNAVAIRGNAPQFTQWRLEGVEIPNPTHFADMSGLGGGFLSALSTQVIGNDINLKYQDLTFKLNFPTRRAGTFSIWGIGLIDRNKVAAEEEQAKWESLGDRQAGSNILDKMAGGLTHKYSINETTYLRSSLTTTYSKDRMIVDQRTQANNDLIRIGDIQNSKWDVVFNSYLNKKFSARHTNRTGITLTGLKYDLDYNVSPYVGLDLPMEQVSKGRGESAVLSAFSNSVINLNSHWSTSLGISAQYFTLNKNWSVEPRAALKWKLDNKHALALAYGLHSRREKLDYYFIEKEINGKTQSNKYLDFSKAHHFGLAYDWNISQSLHLKIEPYYQHLFHIPVEMNTSFSTINHEDFYLDRLLVNKGLGRNYGIDITLEQYMRNGFYYMLTGSLFKSKYKGGDGIWRNSRMDKGFMLNLLAGKEWMIGKRKQNVLSLNGRIYFHGGGRYTPVDEAMSLEKHEIVFDETQAFSKRFAPAINGDLSMSYRINKKKVSHEFAVKILNVGMSTGMHFYEYDERNGKIKQEDGMGLIPNISYKIYF